MSTRKYYLRINGNIIVNLNDYKKYGDMTNFVSLCLFTSDFDSISEIIHELKRVGILRKNTEANTMDIVKSFKDQYYFVTSPPLFKSEAPYFDINIVKKFFKENLCFYDEMELILSRSKTQLEAKLSTDNNLVDPKAKYQEIIIARILNIKRIEVLIERLKRREPCQFAEYMQRLNRFVKEEILYQSGNKTFINYSGLLAMAKTIKILLHNYPHLHNPASILEPKEIITCVSTQDDLDPDSYMFLEDKDFNGLYSDKCQDAFVTQLENLAEKKNRSVKWK